VKNGDSDGDGHGGTFLVVSMQPFSHRHTPTLKILANGTFEKNRTFENISHRSIGM
jgi:hypothetical protein